MINQDDNLLISNYLHEVFSSSYPLFTPIEFVIKPECNQKCEYCYITKYGSSLYPHVHRANNDTLLNNITILLDYFLKQKYYLGEVELFAGDLFYDNFFFSVMDVFYNYYLNIYKINPHLFENHKAKITIPCNFSFCEKKEKIAQFKQVFDKFMDINVYIFLSYSSDGLYAVDVREKRNLSSEFIENVFTLIYECGYGAHPMISYEGIDFAIENYEWWKTKLMEYNKKYNKIEKEGIIPCSLEVRNEGWTEQEINKYVALLDYMVDDRLQLCNNDLNWLACEVFCRDDKRKKYTKIGPPCMDPIKIIYPNANQNYATCNLGNGLVIECNDLAFIPCHRLAYPFYHGAQFIIENNQVTGIKALENVSGYLNLIHTNKFYAPKCATCDYQRICIKGCCGAQFEAMQDPNVPIPDVCNLLQAKINFLVKKYYDLGILKIAINNRFLTEADIQATFKILTLLGVEVDEQQLLGN